MNPLVSASEPRDEDLCERREVRVFQARADTPLKRAQM